MKKNPLVSIVIPVYNVEKYLSECLDSVIAQTYKNTEIILVNDGSTDSSLNICNEYLNKYNNIFVYNKKNGGLSSARNYGIDKCNGEFVTFVDSDDSIDINTIKWMIDDLNAYPQAEIIITSFNQNKKARTVLYDKDNKSELFSRVLHNSGINHSACGKLFAKRLFDTYRFPLSKYYEDYYIVYNILDDANFILIDDRKAYFYRYNEDSITKKTSNAEKKVLDYIEASINMERMLINRDKRLNDFVFERKMQDRINMLDLLRDNSNSMLYQKIMDEILEQKWYKVLFRKISIRLRFKLIKIIIFKKR